MLMIDIETLGLPPTPIIIQVGWAFGTNIETGIKSGQVNVEPESCAELGGDCTLSTVEWWITKGGAEAYETTLADRTTMVGALRTIDEVCRHFKPETVWGNSPTMDLSALRFYYAALGMKCPWEYWQERDYRTARQLLDFQTCEVTTAHNGQADAVAQLESLIMAMEQPQPNA